MIHWCGTGLSAIPGLRRLIERGHPVTVWNRTPDKARAAVGDIARALDRLRAAQDQARSVSGQDFIEASVIDARLRRLMAERRQLALDARGERGGRGGDPGDPDGAPR